MIINTSIMGYPAKNCRFRVIGKIVSWSNQAGIPLSKTLVLALASTIFLGGCVSSFKPQPEPFGGVRGRASPPIDSKTHLELTTLPEPAGPVTAAVYSFSDLTGQNKQAPSSGLSTAVTQGAVNLLIKALLDSRWFLPLERNGFQNLLTERSLWDQRLAVSGDGTRRLAPLPPAGLIIEGGVIAYEFNIRSGGYGAKYLGIGGFRNYREDVLTISLRAVNAQTGTILHSVNSTKTIYSREVNMGLFGYVDFDIIAELENGYAFNEPIQRGVEEAIESALIDLIVEGVLGGTWRLKNPAEIGHPTFARFLSEADLQAYKIRVSSAAGSIPDNSTAAQAKLPAPSSVVTAATVEGPQSDEVPPTSTTDQPAAESSPAPVVPDKGDWTTVPDGIARPRASLDEISDDRLGRVQGATVSPEPTSPSPDIAMKVPTEMIGNDTDADGSSSEDVDRRDAGVVDSTPLQESIPSEEPVFKPVMIVFGFVSDNEEARKFHTAMDERYDGVDVMLLKDEEANGYRVGIGPIEDSEDSEAILEDLKRLGFESIQVRPF